jgi:hypothetical protein
VVAPIAVGILALWLSGHEFWVWLTEGERAVRELYRGQDIYISPTELLSIIVIVLAAVAGLSAIGTFIGKWVASRK